MMQNNSEGKNEIHGNNDAPASTDFSIFQRTWHKTDVVAECAQKFTVVTYNILSDNAIHDGEYLYCPPEVRYMKSRHPRIMAEVAEMKADIVCMQEVDGDNFRCRLKPDMEQEGYSAVFHVKDKHIDSFNHSLCIFYKPTLFRLKQQKHCILHNLAETSIQMASCSDEMKQTIRDSIRRPMVAIMVKLEHVTSGQVLSLCNVHITWDSFHYPALQMLQVSTLVDEFVQFAGGPDQPHIICGDFNSPPDHPAYNTLTDRCLSERVQDCLEKYTRNRTKKNDVAVKELAHLLPAKTFQINSHLNSAYKSAMGEEPDVTSSDSSESEECSAQCLDYLWYSNNSLDVTGVLATPPKDAILRHLSLPSILFPSDHISLKAEFAFK